DKSGEILFTRFLANISCLNLSSFSIDSSSCSSATAVVMAKSAGAKFSSSISYPTRDSMSSGNESFQLKEYSFVITLSDTIINNMETIAPLTNGQFVTVDANRLQNVDVFRSKDPTSGI